MGTSNINPLNSLERSTLRKYEKVIEAHFQTFLDVGNALMNINGEGLYRETHQSFGGYCTDRWGLTKRRAYQLMQGAEIGQQVGTAVHTSTQESQTVDQLVPDKERQTRELAKLPEETRPVAWSKAVSDAGGEQPTASQVRSVVESYLTDEEDAVEDPEEPLPEDEPEEEEEPTTEDQIAEHDKAIEAFCRALMKDAKKNRPDVEWLDHKGRWDGFMRKLKQGLDTLRSAKAAACPACEGDGCKECLQLGYLPKVEAESISV